MITFYPEHFADIYNTSLGRRLWCFLNRRDNLIKMETATFLRKPAAQALSEQLLKEFGDVVRRDRIKQTIGFMIKRVMANRGYKLEKYGVLISDKKNIFTKASRYSK